MKVCIVGGVAGGATAAARLRRLNEQAQIIMFERGDYISFANCGLPYHISGKIKDRSRLLLQTPASFFSRFQVEVRVNNEVLAIEPARKSIRVKNLKTGAEYHESYDYLILSPGAYPFVPPLEGADARMFMRLRDMADMDAIIAHIREHKVREAVVIGGGFIGVEMAENLVEMGIRTHLVEMMNQVMAPFDPEMANIIHAKLAEKGVCLHLGDGIQRIVGDTKGKVILKSGAELNADVVIGALGVRPDHKLARDAGLQIGTTGGIAVDEQMRTSDPFIFAVGDAVETTQFVEGRQVHVPLAGPANRQGRIAADNICGLNSRYQKTLGTAILKVFDLQAASTGLNEKAAQRGGIKYQAIHLHPFNHAGYYPGASQMTLKVLFEVPGGRVLGAQGIGAEGVDKRIDVLATAIRAGMTVYDLEQLELSYAPPFGSAKDPVNMAGFVGSNILKGLVNVVTYDQARAIENPLFLDVRTKPEYMLGSIPQSVNIPVDELRSRMHELPKDRHIVITCQVGIRAYVAYRILKQSGFEHLYNLSGGYKTYSHSTARISPAPDCGQGNDVPDCCQSSSGNGSSSACCGTSGDSGGKTSASTSAQVEELDLTGLQCPGPIMRLSRKLETMKTGDRVAVRASDPGFTKDLPAFCQAAGLKILDTRWEGRDYHALIERAEKEHRQSGNNHNGNRKTIVVFSNDLDRALATFVIANGARAMGNEVTLFFTFWGLNILRKERATPARKPLLDRMFGMMMPKGAQRLKLSKLHMLGMGTGMMKYVMKEKNVDSLASLIEAAMKSGIKFVVCSMSMDVMGIKKEELIDGVEVGGVAQYLSEADRANMNLFI
ncbi:MAG: FAD-dependent oxidoreductase [bacterium]